MDLSLGDFTFDLGERVVVMGILNITPDSFYDGGRHGDVESAVRRGLEMVAEGAGIIDIGGESTRPKALPVGEEEEIRRIRPVVKALLENGGVPISIDTRKAKVAREMLALGAHMVNDVSGFTYDPDMPYVAKDFGVPVVLMHMRGNPENMQDFTTYEDVVTDVKREISERLEKVEGAGIDPRKIIIDPGIGFSKTAEQCVEIISRLDEFLDLGKPVLIGPSRKSFIGKILGLDKEDRLEASIASCIVGVSKGAAMVRVHDVAQVSRALRMFDVFRRHGRVRETGESHGWSG
jgi:dihydropteroate synthase